jgi:hypothetical protein
MSQTEIIPHIVMLYGRPGVGKLTIAEYLTAETGFSLLHNHAVVDLATALFPFGSLAFISLREKLWHLSVDAVLKARSPGTIMTFAPEKTVTDGFIPSLQKRVETGGGVLHLIELRCTPQELESRLGSEQRQRFGKLRDVEAYQKLDAAGAFDRPVMPAPELVVDTTEQTPLVSARMIAKHLKPPRKSAEEG